MTGRLLSADKSLRLTIAKILFSFNSGTNSTYPGFWEDTRQEVKDSLMERADIIIAKCQAEQTLTAAEYQKEIEELKNCVEKDAEAISELLVGKVKLQASHQAKITELFQEMKSNKYFMEDFEDWFNELSSKYEVKT